MESYCKFLTTLNSVEVAFKAFIICGLAVFFFILLLSSAGPHISDEEFQRTIDL